MGPIKSAAQISRGRPLNVVGDHQVELSIAVVVDPGSAGAEFADSRKPSARGNVGKCAIATVVKQTALAKSGYKDVVITIIVVVADGHAQSIHADCQASFGGHIGERPVVVVVVEIQRRSGLALPGPVLTVDQQNVGIA